MIASINHSRQITATADRIPCFSVFSVADYLATENTEIHRMGQTHSISLLTINDDGNFSKNGGGKLSQRLCAQMAKGAELDKVICQNLQGMGYGK